ncbi:MAG: Gfo/Idh/MocA family oxidoreductase [Thermofilum sp.]|nr:Gfo/Idh/MocA family oxidoreductase [Thermofilum sp.]
MRVAVVGCGGMGNAHLRDLLQLKSQGFDVDVRYLVDVDASKAEALRAKYGLKEAEALTDYRKALGKVDAAVVATPHAEHYQQIMDFVASGAHVLVEKPMVCNLRQALDVYEAWRRSGLVVEVAFQRHFERPWVAARDLVSKGAIGRIEMVSMILGQAYTGVKGTWRAVRKISCGGELIDSGSHFMDAALWITGLRAEEAFAYMDYRGFEIDINTALVAKLEGGPLLLFTVAGDDPSWLEVEIFWGEGGRLIVQPPAVLLQRKGGGGEAVNLEPYPQSRPVFNFVKAIEKLEENGSPPLCGLRVQELADAAYRSVELGRPVKVAELYEELGAARP